MGAYFSIIVLPCTPAKADAAVAAWLGTSGWAEAEDATASCTTFVAGPEAVGVVGDPVPSGAPELLRDTTTELSRHASGLAVGIDVEDSDILTLAVADAGFPRQLVRIGPAVKGPVPAPDPIWVRLLGPEHSHDDLAAAWAAPATYAEEVLDRTCALCGWAGDRLQPHAASTRPVVTKRHVRLISPDVRKEVAEEGAQLGHVGGDDAVTAGVRGDVRLQVVAHSVAGQGAGLTVIVWGPALDGGLIHPQAVELIVGHPAAPRARTAAPLSNDGSLAIARFDVAIPRGFVNQAAAVRGVSTEEGVRRWLETRIEATVTARTVRAGVGVMHVGLIPDHAEDRAVTWSVDVDVAP